MTSLDRRYICYLPLSIYLEKMFFDLMFDTETHTIVEGSKINEKSTGKGRA